MTMVGLRARATSCAIVVGLLLGSVEQATAQRRTPSRLFESGTRHFDLQEFEKAIADFKAAYSIDPKPQLLFNIAQAYRFLPHCRNARFYYQRFLDGMANAGKPIERDQRRMIQTWIQQLDACIQREDTPAARSAPEPAASEEVASAAAGPSDAVEVIVADRVRDRWHAVGRLTVGGAHVASGEITTTQPSFGLSVGYPIPIGERFALELGGAAGFVPVPYRATVSRTARITTARLNAAAALDATSKLAVRAELGAGVLGFGGLATGNPFVEGGREVTGTLAMLDLRIAAGIDYAATRRVLITAVPIALSYAVERDGARALLRFEASIGVGIRI